jgi:hypothetical protein
MTLATTTPPSEADTWPGVTGSTYSIAPGESWLGVLRRWLWDYGAKQSLCEHETGAVHDLNVADSQAGADLDVEFPLVVQVGPKSRRRIDVAVVRRVRLEPKPILP